MATIQEALANALKQRQADGAAAVAPTPVEAPVLPDSLKSIIDNLRQTYGEKIAAFNDLQVLRTWQDWSMSAENENPEFFVEWLTAKYGEIPPVSMAEHAAAAAATPSTEADPNHLTLEEIQRRVADGEITSQDAVELLNQHGHLDEEDDEADGASEDSGEFDPDGANAGDRYAEPDTEMDTITFKDENGNVHSQEVPVAPEISALAEAMTAESAETMYQEGMITESERDSFLAVLNAEAMERPSLGEMLDTELAQSQTEQGPTVIEVSATTMPVEEHPKPHPVLVNPMEELTQRQTLAVIADHLKERRQEELFSILGDILGRVYKMEAITESDVMVALADNVRLVDFVVAMTREVGIEPAMPKNHIIPINVESSSIIFKPRKTRYNMTDLETAMVNAISRIRNHMKIADKVEGLEQRIKNLEGELRTANLATKAAKDVADSAASSLAIERQKPTPIPAFIKGKSGVVVASWFTDKVKTNKKTGVKTVTGSTRYYLSTAEGAALNAKGDMPTKLWRRTTDVADAFLFDNAAEAARVMERINKNAKHLVPESGITEKVLSKITLLTVTTVPV